MPTRRRLLAAALLLATLASACASGEEPSGSATDGAGRSTTAPTDTTAPEVAASAGCGTSTTRAVTAERRSLGDDSGRWYLLTTPESHDGRTPLPLVLDFHGLAEGAEVHTRMSAYGDLAAREGFVVAFPQGSGAVPSWKFHLAEDNPDLAFVDRLLDELGEQLCIDTSRVYAAGLSNGAFMSSALACARAERFAAVAPVAGVLHPEGCEPTRPVPVLAFHGTADPILLFNGGIGDLGGALSGQTPTTAPGPPPDLDGAGYPEAVRNWAVGNGCAPTPSDTEVSPTVLHRVYDCPDGADVEFYVIRDGGHTWPGSRFNASIERITGPTTMDIDATELSWRFFQRFQLPT
jgi:polyhydroxybutyrate depolymerase